MKRNQSPHVAIGTAFATQPVATPTQMACAQTLVSTAAMMWFHPDHRSVVTDGLATLKTNVEASKAAGKHDLLASIADLNKSIAAQPSERPQVQNGAGDQPHPSQHGGQSTAERTGGGH